jgi:hypothetical protein
MVLFALGNSLRHGFGRGPERRNLGAYFSEQHSDWVGLGCSYSFGVDLTDLHIRRPKHGDDTVVEDEEAIRQLVSVVLEAAGHEVIVASNGVEGIALFRSSPDRFALILTDLKMPVMDG